MGARDRWASGRMSHVLAQDAAGAAPPPGGVRRHRGGVAPRGPGGGLCAPLHHRGGQRGPLEQAGRDQRVRCRPRGQARRRARRRGHPGRSSPADDGVAAPLPRRSRGHDHDRSDHRPTGRVSGAGARQRPADGADRRARARQEAGRAGRRGRLDRRLGRSRCSTSARVTCSSSKRSRSRAARPARPRCRSTASTAPSPTRRRPRTGPTSSATSTRRTQTLRRLRRSCSRARSRSSPSNGSLAATRSHIAGSTLSSGAT